MSELTVVEQKNVQFGDNEILVAKTNDGKLYAAIRWVCEGIGLSKGQMQAERKKVQEDLVLSKGERNFVLPTNSGVHGVQCIDLDFLPLWLAKISITPAMQENNPDAVENLVKYQLKAKDVLAAAFLPQNVPNDPITLALTAALETRKTLEIVQTDVNHLKETMRIDGVEQFQINEAGKRKAIAALGGKSSAAYKELNRRVFSELWRDFKQYFTVPRYSELPKVKFSEALEFISIWEPSAAVKMEIKHLNGQVA